MQSRLSESLGVAVDLGPIGVGKFLRNSQGGKGDPEAVRAEGRTVVGNHALDGNAQFGKGLGGGLHAATTSCLNSGL